MANRNSSPANSITTSELDDVNRMLTQAKAICRLAAIADLHAERVEDHEESAMALWAAQNLISEAVERLESLPKATAGVQ